MNSFAINDWDELEARYFGRNTGTYDYVPGYSYVPGQEPGNRRALTSGYPTPDYSQEVPSRNIDDHDKNMKKKAELLRRRGYLDAFRSKERYISGKRLKEAIVVTLGIAVVASMFAFILYRQSQISSLNFQNNAVQKNITKLEQETRQIQEELIANADLVQIRWEAIERLAMQEPSAKQMIVVKIPAADQLFTNDSIFASVSSKVSLAEAKTNLEEYYLTLE